MLLVLIYLACIALGTLLLWLPISNNGHVGLVESLFTATSAVTVTGLAIVDTGTAFTTFGQLVILVLVQLGGLGLMTFAVLVLSALGISIGMPQKLVLREDLNQTSLSNLTVLVKVIFVVAILCEFVGAILLAFVFVPEFGTSGVWQAIFHSVSAFNNAGFGLHPDSLSAWVGNPIVNTVIPALFILGGLGIHCGWGYVPDKKLARLDATFQVNAGRHIVFNRSGRHYVWTSRMAQFTDTGKLKYQRETLGQLVSGGIATYRWIQYR